MSLLNPPCDHLMVNPWLQILLFMVMMFWLISKQGASGVDDRVHFFDVRVFHPNTTSYHITQVASLCRRHELEKKREYGDHVQAVEFASFTFGILNFWWSR